MMGMFLVQRQEKTVRTRILEFLRAPFTGSWIGTPGFMTVAQIADGAECSKHHARRVLGALAKSKQVRVAEGRPLMFAVLEVTMNIWTITNIASGQDLGGYEATDADAALDAMARDAGYVDFSSSCSAIGKPEQDARKELRVDLCTLSR